MPGRGCAGASVCEEASRIAQERVRNKGFNDRVVRLINAVGHSSLKEAEEILNKGSLTEENVAFLLMHYIDDYTINDQWARPAEIKAGIKINDLDRRMDKNEAHPRYTRLNQEGIKRFNGETSFQAQRRVGHAVERKIAALLQERTGQQIEPLDLPVFVDQQIMRKIELL